MAEGYDRRGVENQHGYRERSASSRRKDTRRWCGGHEGREHQLIIQVPPNMATHKPPHCGFWYAWMPDRYTCRHVQMCTVCGKQVRVFLEKEECPDFPEGWSEREPFELA